MLISIINSDGAQTIVALLGLVIGYILYRIKINDMKVTTYKILYLDIIAIQKFIEVIKKSIGSDERMNIFVDTPIFKKNDSWDKAKPYLIRKLSNEEFQYLDDYFEKIETINREIERLKKFYDNYQYEKANAIQIKLVDLAYEVGKGTQGLDYNTVRNTITDTMHKETYFYISTISDKIFAKYLPLINNLTNTPIGVKLKKLAKIH